MGVEGGRWASGTGCLCSHAGQAAGSVLPCACAQPSRAFQQAQRPARRASPPCCPATHPPPLTDQRLPRRRRRPLPAGRAVPAEGPSQQGCLRLRSAPAASSTRCYRRPAACASAHLAKVRLLPLLTSAAAGQVSLDQGFHKNRAVRSAQKKSGKSRTARLSHQHTTCIFLSPRAQSLAAHPLPAGDDGGGQRGRGRGCGSHRH